MKPYDRVKEHYTLPFELYEFQSGAVNELADLPRAGYYFEPGVGKTAASTVSALYRNTLRRGHQTLVVMPPILINMWARWLRRIKPTPAVTVYRGTPKAARVKIVVA